MEPKVSIIMGSTSDLPIMEKACKVLNDFKIPCVARLALAYRNRKRNQA